MSDEMDVGFLDEVAGQGFENMGAGEVATPLLLISQALSQNVADGTMPVGHFYNSITGKDYGASVKVVVCHFDKMWYEWKPDQGGLVGRYPVGGLEGVTGDNFTGMKHGENKVEEKYVYLVMLPDYPEDGFLVFGSTGGNLKYLKGWNTQMRYLRTPSGKPAPVFSAIWELTLNKDKNKAGNIYYSCNKEGKSSIRFAEWVSKEQFTEYVLPARQVADQAIALADNRSDVKAIEDSSDGNTDY